MGRCDIAAQAGRDAIVLDEQLHDVGEQMAWFRKEFEQVTR